MAYTRMLRVYYATERPLPADKRAVYRLVRAASKVEREAVDAVLGEFFISANDGFHQKRCDEEIERRQSQAHINREIGKRGGRPNKTETVSENNRIGSENETETVSENNPSHKPIASSQKPEAKNQELRLTPLRVADEARHAVNGFAPIIESYHEALPNCLRITVLNPKRKRRLATVRKLAKQLCEQQGWPYDERRFFSAYWHECANDPWLRGDVANPHNPRWKQNLDVLLAEDRFATVMDHAIEAMRGGA